MEKHVDQVRGPRDRPPVHVERHAVLLALGTATRGIRETAGRSAEDLDLGRRAVARDAHPDRHPRFADVAILRFFRPWTRPFAPQRRGRTRQVGGWRIGDAANLRIRVGDGIAAGSLGRAIPSGIGLSLADDQIESGQIHGTGWRRGLRDHSTCLRRGWRRGGGPRRPGRGWRRGRWGGGGWRRHWGALQRCRDRRARRGRRWLCRRPVLQRGGPAQHGMCRKGGEQGSQVARAMPAGVEVLQRGERRFSVSEASARDDEPPPASALKREAHGAGGSWGAERSTAKAMLLTCACESRSMTWMTRRCGTSPSAWITARRSGCCASSWSAWSLMASSLATPRPFTELPPCLVSCTEKMTCTASPVADRGSCTPSALVGPTTSLDVTMKMISSTSMMSTNGVTLIPLIMLLPPFAAPPALTCLAVEPRRRPPRCPATPPRRGGRAGRCSRPRCLRPPPGSCAGTS